MADTTFLDWPFFEDHHRKLAAELDAWAADNLAGPDQSEGHGNATDAVDTRTRLLAAALGEAGWLGYVVPRAFGGVHESLDVRSLCLCRETLARYSGLADFAFAMQGLGTGSITLYGTDELKRKYLPPVVAGKSLAAFALSEPDAGSDVAALATTAVRDGDEFVLNGTKTWISNGGIAGHYVVFARTGEGEGTRGLSAFVVDAGAPGLKVAERISVIAPHPLATIVFEDCRVPAANLLGAPGEGFKVAMATLDIFRSTVGAAALGLARRALDEALARVRSRQVFGKPLAEFQMTQAKIADMAVDVDAAALLVYRAAWTKDTQGGRVTREAAMAKLFATESAQAVIDQAVQLLGGLGVVSGHPVEQLYREIRALRIYEGTSEIQRIVIASDVVGGD